MTEYLAWLGEEGSEDIFFADRQLRFAELGLHAASVSEELRACVGLPPRIDPRSETVDWLKKKHESLHRVEVERQARQDKIMSGLSILINGSDN